MYKADGLVWRSGKAALAGQRLRAVWRQWGRTGGLLSRLRQSRTWLWMRLRTGMLVPRRDPPGAGEASRGPAPAACGARLRHTERGCGGQAAVRGVRQGWCSRLTSSHLVQVLRVNVTRRKSVLSRRPNRGARVWDLAATAAPSPPRGDPSSTHGSDCRSAASIPADLPGDVWGPLGPIPGAVPAMPRAGGLAGLTPRCRVPCAAQPVASRFTPARRQPGRGKRTRRPLRGATAAGRSRGRNTSFLASSLAPSFPLLSPHAPDGRSAASPRVHGRPAGSPTGTPGSHPHEAAGWGGGSRPSGSGRAAPRPPPRYSRARGAPRGPEPCLLPGSPSAGPAPRGARCARGVAAGGSGRAV